MAHPPIAVSFTSLLAKSVTALGLGTPIYNRACSGKDIVYVVVPFKNDPTSYVFSGIGANTISESYEVAARKVVVFLARNTNLCVQDVNLEKKQRLRKCRDYYTFKRHEFECIEKGIERHNVKVALNRADKSPCPIEVCIDFMEVLRGVVRKLNIHVTPMEVVGLGPAEFVSWLSYAEPHTQDLVDCITGDIAPSIMQAKESVAKKAIQTLMPLYGFIVQDVSYYLLDTEELGLKVARQNYLKIKERVHGLQEDVALIPYVVDQDQLTPRGPKYTIPTLSSPPLPPKKRRTGEFSASSSSTANIVPHSVVVTELALFPVNNKDK